MKRIPLILLVCIAALLAGCAHRYDLTLTNGVRITNVSKPVLHRDEGVYVFKDGTGTLRRITSGRVVEIAPTGSRKPNGFRQ